MRPGNETPASPKKNANLRGCWDKRNDHCFSCENPKELHGTWKSPHEAFFVLRVSYDQGNPNLRPLLKLDENVSLEELAASVRPSVLSVTLRIYESTSNNVTLEAFWPDVTQLLRKSYKILYICIPPAL